MTVIAVFAAFVLIGNTIIIAICSLIERVSETASLFAFLGLFALVFVIAWSLAVRVTERYFMRSG